MNWKTYKLLLLLVLLSLHTVLAQESISNDNLSSTYGSNMELPSIQVIPITDSETGRHYELFVKLHKGYSENEDTKISGALFY